MSIGVAWTATKLFLSQVNWKLTGILVALALVAGAVGYVSHIRSELAERSFELAEAQEDLAVLKRSQKASSAASVVKEAVTTQIIQEEVHGRSKTTEALRDNPEWSGTPVPADVLDSLRN